MGFKVQTDNLRTHAKLWGGHADDVGTAKTTIGPGVEQGDDFGYLAGLNEVSDHYDTWSKAMDEALGDAKKCFDYIEAALDSAANDYDDTDATVATDMATLDKMI